jgi:guanylate kinase
VSNAVEPGRLVIISGPSGSGKSSVVSHLLKHCPLPLKLSVSATTRPPRENETDGVQYRFLSRAQFDSLREKGDFLECVEVFGRGDWYGTLKEPVTTGLKAGKWIILEIDVQGALKVIELNSSAITIFIHPGSLDELERRLRGRGTESEEKIQRRLAVAKSEMEKASHYQHVVINKVVEQASTEICQILQDRGESTECITT